MPEREILIKLLRQADEDVANKVITDYEEAIAANADYLLVNDVIALPKLKHRQKLYFICEGKIKEVEFSSYQIRPEHNNIIQIHASKNGFNFVCNADDIGKTVFLTREEAEEALKVRCRKCNSILINV